MAEVRIVAESRTEFGKGAARRVRRDHKVPAVLYGHGNDPRHITLPGHDLMLALKVKNALLTLEMAGGSDELAIPKDIQRDPIRGTIEHVDLLVVRRGEKVKVNVALHVIGHAVPDSLVVSELNAIEIECEATHIPTGFDIDITGKAIGTQILAKDITLPAGIELVTDPDALVVNVTGAQTEAEAEAEMAEAEAEAGIVHEAPDAAAPAEALPGSE